ncbi:hypothetical protein [Rhizobium anhuiense]|uniref:hypothetical protein n=1 Tax=Rhizobium anhuiense TaxID=1184720 RepID=UPI001FE1790A|nr:hypothetical protein [Rhizobium anhuiense]
MNFGIAFLFTISLWASARILGLEAQLTLALIVVAIFLSGRVTGIISGINEPFLEFIAGFSIISYLLLISQYFSLFLQCSIISFIFFILICAYFRCSTTSRSRNDLVLGIVVALFTFIWSYDLVTRLQEFKETGKLQFWSDILLHAGTIAQFSASSSLHRGMTSMADVQLPLYHVASYMPTALVARLSEISALNAAVLVWIPLGTLTMATGIVALGIALGGRGIALVALTAIALVPSPDRIILGNGLLSFPWLLDAAPGTAYSLGVACGSIAMLIYWMKTKSRAALVVGSFLCAACLLVRANTFAWLAPCLVLSLVVGTTKLSRSQKILSVICGLTLLCLLLIAISWSEIRTNAADFLFSYVETVHLGQPPTGYQALYPRLTQTLGREGAAVIGIGLVFTGILGPWIAIFFGAAAVCGTQKKLVEFDAIPFLLLAVASIMVILAPMPPNGDITEFRHRAGPLLVVVTCVWSVRFIAMAAPALLPGATATASWKLLVFAATISLALMATNISELRRPQMDWAKNFYDVQFPPALFAVASELEKNVEDTPRFVVAGQPEASRDIDDASALVALSGIPAYISRPRLFELRSDNVGNEARRRIEVVKRLDAAPTVSALKQLMASEHITHYLVTNTTQMAFDSERTGATWKSGQYAIYTDR